jgi:hypothetical protein
MDHYPSFIQSCSEFLSGIQQQLQAKILKTIIVERHGFVLNIALTNAANLILIALRLNFK